MVSILGNIRVRLSWLVEIELTGKQATKTLWRNGIEAYIVIKTATPEPSLKIKT